MLILIGIVTGLPATALPVMGSTALTVALVVIVVPPETPVVSTMTSTEVVAPPARSVPEPADSETYAGAFESSTILQLNGFPPVLPILMAFDVVPLLPLKFNPLGLTVREGAAEAVAAETV